MSVSLRVPIQWIDVDEMNTVCVCTLLLHPQDLLHHKHRPRGDQRLVPMTQHTISEDLVKVRCKM